MSKKQGPAKFEIEVDGRGNFRIVRKQGTSIIEGEWTSYHGIAKIAYGSETYISVTDYHDGGPMESGRVYLLRDVGD